MDLSKGYLTSAELEELASALQREAQSTLNHHEWIEETATANGSLQEMHIGHRPRTPLGRRTMLYLHELRQLHQHLKRAADAVEFARVSRRVLKGI